MHHTVFFVYTEDRQKFLRDYVEFYVGLVQATGGHISTTRAVIKADKRPNTVRKVRMH
jgi:hypothetical protein